MEDLEWRLKNGGFGMGNGGRKMANEEWRMENDAGKRLKMGNKFFHFNFLDLLFIMRIRYFHRCPRSRSKTFKGKIQRTK